MPRNGSGTYSLPQAPFQPGTVISSSAVNSDLSDIATALTGSLPRDGSAGMSGQLKVADGSPSVPGWAFSNETSTGFSRASAGVLSVDILGTQVAQITTAGWVGPVQGGNPVGCVLDFAGSTVPAQWLLCFGQAVSRTTYALLFAVTGTAFGVGDGSTTFNIPDLRGRAAFGVDNMGGSTAGRITAAGGNFDGTTIGNTGGLQNHTLTTTEIPSHTHSNSLSDSGHFHSTLIPQPLASFAGGAFSANAGAYTTNQNSDVKVSNITLSNAAAGGGALHTVLNPAFMLNKIIFAGV